MLELFAMGFTRMKTYSWEEMLYRFEESNARNPVPITFTSRLEIFLLCWVLARLEWTPPVIILSPI